MLENKTETTKPETEAPEKIEGEAIFSPGLLNAGVGNQRPDKVLPTNILRLQQTLGNQVVQRLIKQQSISRSTRPVANSSVQRLVNKGMLTSQSVSPTVIQRDKINNLEDLNKAGVVSKFLESDKKQALEEHLEKPKLTGNAMDALKLADKVAKMHAEENKKAVEDRLVKIGIDLEKYPDAYDLCYDYVANKKLTINIGTHLLKVIFNHPDYLNMWNLSFQTSDDNYTAGRDLTERTLHGLPEMSDSDGANTHRKPGQKFNRDLLKEGLKLKAHVKSHEEAQSGTKLKETAPERTPSSKLEEFDKWLDSNSGELEEESFDKAVKDILGESWLDWYYSSRDDKAETGQEIDRPISSGVNINNYRGGAAPAYGTTHLELKDSVKDRATVTGQDSKDFIYEKALGAEAVGTFEELGPVLRYMEEAAFKRLADLAVLKKDPASLKNEIGYVEAQIFGGIDLTRDVSKIVIDQDDLDLWAAGKLLINPLLGEGTRPPEDVTKIKASVIAFGKKHDIPVQFIRSGKDKDRPGHVSIKNKAEDKLNNRKVWEDPVENSMEFFAVGNWLEAIGEFAKLDPAEEVRRGEPSKKAMGLDKLENIKNTATKLEGKVGGVSALYLEDQLKLLAKDIREAYYLSAVDAEYLPIQLRIATKALKSLTNMTSVLLKKQAGY